MITRLSDYTIKRLESAVSYRLRISYRHDPEPESTRTTDATFADCKLACCTLPASSSKRQVPNFKLTADSR
jgi:hypothetical protein